MSADADHERDDEVPEAGEDRHDDREDHERRVLGDEHVERLRVEVLVARTRQLGAEDEREQPADDEEGHRRDEVLHTDHLVVGVRAEVVAPAARPVPRVVLWPRRLAGVVVGPVVEGADANQEADRERSRSRSSRAVSRSRSGASCAQLRIRQAKPIQKKPNSGVVQSARSQPGPVKRCQPVGTRRWAVVAAGTVGVGMGVSHLGHRSVPSILSGCGPPDTAQAAASCAFGMVVPNGRRHDAGLVARRDVLVRASRSRCG